jgi:hypothetical protein
MSIPEDSIELVAEHVLRTSAHLDSAHRIQLLEATAALVPDATPRREIERIAENLRQADRACREFSFSDLSE